MDDVRNLMINKEHPLINDFGLDSWVSSHSLKDNLGMSVTGILIPLQVE